MHETRLESVLNFRFQSLGVRFEKKKNQLTWNILQTRPENNFKQVCVENSKNYKEKYLLSHERHMDGLPVEFGGELGGLGDAPAVHEPESSGDCRREIHAIFHKGQRRRSCHILPLGPGCAA